MLHGHWTQDMYGHGTNGRTLHAHCMCTACALHAHCMRTACALHAHCMRTACALSNFMCAAGGRMEEDQGQVADGHEGATPSPAPLPLLPVSHPITTEERRRRAIRTATATATATLTLPTHPGREGQEGEQVRHGPGQLCGRPHPRRRPVLQRAPLGRYRRKVLRALQEPGRAPPLPTPLTLHSLDYTPCYTPHYTPHYTPYDTP